MIPRPPDWQPTKEYQRKRKAYIESLSPILKNMVNNRDMLKAIVEQYDGGVEPHTLVANTIVAVLLQVWKEIGGEIELTATFQMAQILLMDLVEDMGRLNRPVTVQQQTDAGIAAMVNFLKQTKGRYDMEKLRVFCEDAERRAKAGQINSIHDMQNGLLGAM